MLSARLCMKLNRRFLNKESHVKVYRTAQEIARNLISVTCCMWDGQQENETRGGTTTHCKKNLEPPVIKGFRDLELTLWVLRGY